MLKRTFAFLILSAIGIGAIAQSQLKQFWFVVFTPASSGNPIGVITHTIDKAHMIPNDPPACTSYGTNCNFGVQITDGNPYSFSVTLGTPTGKYACQFSFKAYPSGPSVKILGGKCTNPMTYKVITNTSNGSNTVNVELNMFVGIPQNKNN